MFNPCLSEELTHNQHIFLCWLSSQAYEDEWIISFLPGAECFRIGIIYSLTMHYKSLT
jgi:hypothetical protein